MEIHLTADKETGKKRFVAVGNPLEFICRRCGENIIEGFICESNDKIILCNECQKEFDMNRCRYDKDGQHSHIKWFKVERTE